MGLPEAGLLSTGERVKRGSTVHMIVSNPPLRLHGLSVITAESDWRLGLLSFTHPLSITDRVPDQERWLPPNY